MLTLNSGHDWRGNTAQVRRLWDHVNQGGKLVPRDTKYCLDTLLKKEGQLAGLQGSPVTERPGTTFARTLSDNFNAGIHPSRKDMSLCVEACEMLDNEICAKLV